MLDAHLHLLDRQVLDRDGTPVTTVDDLELDGIELGARIEPGCPAADRRGDPHRSAAR